MLNGIAGQYAFCQDCAEYETCQHDKQKIHPLSTYVYRYLSDIESGFKCYPNPGSWEMQTDWFIRLLSSAQAELETLRQAEAKKGK